MFLRESIAANSPGGKFLFRLEQNTPRCGPPCGAAPSPSVGVAKGGEVASTGDESGRVLRAWQNEPSRGGSWLFLLVRAPPSFYQNFGDKCLQPFCDATLNAIERSSLAKSRRTHAYRRSYPGPDPDEPARARYPQGHGPRAAGRAPPGRGGTPAG